MESIKEIKQLTSIEISSSLDNGLETQWREASVGKKILISLGWRVEKIALTAFTLMEASFIVGGSFLNAAAISSSGLFTLLPSLALSTLGKHAAIQSCARKILRGLQIAADTTCGSLATISLLAIDTLAPVFDCLKKQKEATTPELRDLGCNRR